MHPKFKPPLLWNPLSKSTRIFVSHTKAAHIFLACVPDITVYTVCQHFIIREGLRTLLSIMLDRLSFGDLLCCVSHQIATGKPSTSHCRLWLWKLSTRWWQSESRNKLSLMSRWETRWSSSIHRTLHLLRRVLCLLQLVLRHRLMYVYAWFVYVIFVSGLPSLTDLTLLADFSETHPDCNHFSGSRSISCNTHVFLCRHCLLIPWPASADST